jgi:hypothetical protein
MQDGWFLPVCRERLGLQEEKIERSRGDIHGKATHLLSSCARQTPVYRRQSLCLPVRERLPDGCAALRPIAGDRSLHEHRPGPERARGCEQGGMAGASFRMALRNHNPGDQGLPEKLALARIFPEAGSREPGVCAHPWLHPLVGWQLSDLVGVHTMRWMAAKSRTPDSFREGSGSHWGNWLSAVLSACEYVLADDRLRSYAPGTRHTLFKDVVGSREEPVRCSLNTCVSDGREEQGRQETEWAVQNATGRFSRPRRK